MFRPIIASKRAALTLAVTLLTLVAVSCSTQPTEAPDATQVPAVESTVAATPDIDATVSAAIAATTEVSPTDTPVPPLVRH